jgi:guanylate kinase
MSTRGEMDRARVAVAGLCHDGRVHGRGVLVIVSSPSGAGKTTLTRRLLAEFGPQLEFSVSYTTRPMRPNEVDGSDYWFVTPDRFEAMVERGEFAEHAFVHQNRYGTAGKPVEGALAAGRDVIFDVDWQGGKALAERWPRDSLKIFILPPSQEALAARLRQRASDSQEVIERRLRKAREELEHFNEYQYLIVNEDLDKAYELLRAMYLTRRYGVADRADVPYPLSSLTTLVAEQRAVAEAHARELID